MTIGELAKKTGVRSQTLRYYEREGLLPPPARAGSGRYRVYGSDDEKRLDFILSAKAAGFTLKEIRSLLWIDRSDGSCESVRNLITRRLSDIEQRIADLDRFKKQLKQLDKTCERSDGTDCPPLSSLRAG